MLKTPDHYHGVDGHLKLVEAEYIYNAPFRLGDGYYGNLGTLHGRSAVHLGGGVKDSGINGKVITVDTVDRGVDKTFEEYGVGLQVESIIQESAVAATSYPDGSFRMVFIDADHSYEGVKADFEAWESKIGVDGEMAFHDSDVPGVKQLLEELAEIGEWKQEGLRHTLSWWRRT